MFDHERLEVYKVAIELVGTANDVIEKLPRGNGKLADQFSRASISIPLNIAEGAGLYAKGEKQRAYRIARGSAMECAAILDVCMRLDIVSESDFGNGKEKLIRIVSMLTKLIQSFKQVFLGNVYGHVHGHVHGTKIANVGVRISRKLKEIET